MITRLSLVFDSHMRSRFSCVGLAVRVIDNFQVEKDAMHTIEDEEPPPALTQPDPDTDADGKLIIHAYVSHDSFSVVFAHVILHPVGQFYEQMKDRNAV